jgi:hypothetical protein
LALEARPGGSRRFWRLKKDVKLDERDPLLLWLSLPHRHVTGARSRSPSQEILAWFYPDRSFVSVVLRVLVSLLLLVGLASITRRSDAARRSGANITARGGKLRRTYLFLRVGAGNLALLAPLLLESLGLFHLQRFGLIEWSIVAVNGAFDLLAVGVILAVVVDRYLVAFLRRVDKGWPRRLFDQLLYASHSGRSARELELLATAHLVLRNGDVLPDSLTAEQVLAHLDQAAAHHLAPGDIAVVAQLRSTPRGELSLQVPLINRVLRLQAASRQVGAIQRQADAAFEEAMEKLGRSPAYRASRERNGDAFVNVVRQELIWLLAVPGAAKHLGGQLHQLEHVAGLSIEPLRGLRALVDGLVPR